MKIAAALASLLLCSCVELYWAASPVASLFNDVHPVWKERGAPSASVLAPRGFNITPSQAYAAARAARRLEEKHIWHLYADSNYYYVHDSFLGSNSALARRFGVRINGRTGAVEPGKITSMVSNPSFRPTAQLQR